MSSSAPTGDSPKSPTREQRVYDEHRGSVVHVSCVRDDGTGKGTGFVVHNDGTSCLVLTCHHVIEQAKKLFVRFGANHTVSPRVVLGSKPMDLALLSIQGAPVCTPLEFSDEADLSGKEVVVMGFIGLDKLSVCMDPGTSRGHILGDAVIQKVSDDDDGLRELFATNLSASRGMSGSPAFLEDKVAGFQVAAVLSSNDSGLINLLAVASVKKIMKTWAGCKKGPEMTVREMLQVIAEKLSRRKAKPS